MSFENLKKQSSIGSLTAKLVKEVEKMSTTAKIDIKYLSSLNCSDIVTEFMVQKFKSYLNL